jgi:hypothetical protein
LGKVKKIKILEFMIDSILTVFYMPILPVV